MLSALLQSNYAQVDATAATDFMAGYLFRLTSQDHDEYLQRCFHADSKLSETIDAAMRDQEAGELEKAMAEWKETASMYEGDLQECGEVLDAYNAIKKYESEVLARPDAKEYIREMIEKNKEWVEGAEAAKIDQWKAGEYFVSGKFAAMAAQYMGIAPPAGQLESGS